MKQVFEDKSEKLVFEDDAPILVFEDLSKKLIFDVPVVTEEETIYAFDYILDFPLA